MAYAAHHQPYKQEEIDRDDIVTLFVVSYSGILQFIRPKSHWTAV